MKKLLLLLILILNNLHSNALENMLMNGNLSKIEEKDTNVINYYSIPLNFENPVITENTTTLEDGATIQAPNDTKWNKYANEYNMKAREEYYKSLKKNARYSNSNEIIIAPYIIKHASIRRISSEEEKIIVSFKIDNNRTISNIKFTKPSKNDEINTTIKNGILDKRFELIKKTNNIEKLTLYFNLIY